MPKYRSDAGATVIELLIAMTVVVTLGAISVPRAASVVDAGRARQAAVFLGSRFRLARQQAVTFGANVGVVFDYAGGRWLVRVCRDGSRNGLRRADIQSGSDPCPDGPHSLGDLFPGVEIAVDPQLRGPAGEPGSPDPVRFGSSDIASFSPFGTCTAGSIFLRSRGGAQYAVRIAGVTGRLRVLWHEAIAGWRER